MSSTGHLMQDTTDDTVVREAVELLDAAAPERARARESHERRGGPGARGPWWSRRVGRWQAAVIMVLVAVVCAWADPAAGTGSWRVTLRLAASFWLALVLVNHGAAIVRWCVARRPRRDKPRMTSRWVLVPIALVLALLARSIGVAPVLVLGAVLATDYGSEAGRARTAVATLAGTVWTFVVAATAYVGYSLLVAHPVRDFVAWDDLEPATAAERWRLAATVNLVATETLASIAVVAVTALVVGLLPFSLFEGANLWRASKVVWASAYAVGAASFLVVAVPVAHTGEWDGPARWWAALYVAFAVAGVAGWLVLGRRRP